MTTTCSMRRRARCDAMLKATLSSWSVGVDDDICEAVLGAKCRVKKIKAEEGRTSPVEAHKKLFEGEKVL